MHPSFKEMTWSLMMMSFHEIRKKWEEWKMGQGLRVLFRVLH